MSTALLLTGGAFFLQSCILPPELEIVAERDDSAPPIVSAVAPAEFTTPGPPIQLELGDERFMTLTVRDNDLADVIFVRFFVDYSRPDRTNSKAECSAPSSGEIEREVPCSMSTIGNGVSLSEEHFLEAVVADQPFLETSDPDAAGQLPFRALPPGSSSSVTAWSLRCLENND